MKKPPDHPPANGACCGVRERRDHIECFDVGRIAEYEAIDVLGPDGAYPFVDPRANLPLTLVIKPVDVMNSYWSYCAAVESIQNTAPWVVIEIVEPAPVHEPMVLRLPRLGAAGGGRFSIIASTSARLSQEIPRPIQRYPSGASSRLASSARSRTSRSHGPTRECGRRTSTQVSPSSFAVRRS